MSSWWPFNKQEQATTREQVVDQNFANNILFKNMSVLQTLEQKVKQEKGSKFFGGYDIIDYSDRPKEMLKEQLRLGLYQVQFSYGEFNKDYKNGYALPKEYDIEKVIQRLKQFQIFFENKSENQIQYMVKDFINILKNKKTQRYYETVRFDSGPTKGFNGNVKNMVQAASVTQKEQQIMQQKFQSNPGMKPEDLEFKKNANYEQKKSGSKHKQDKKGDKNEGMQDQKQLSLKKSGQNEQQSSAMDQQLKKPVTQGQDSHKIKKIQKMHFHQGQFYTGEVNEQNMPHGRGKFSSSIAKFQAEGLFVNGRYDGQIKFISTLSGRGWIQIWKDGKYIKTK